MCAMDIPMASSGTDLSSNFNFVLYVQYTGNFLVWALRHIDCGGSEFSFAFSGVCLLWQASTDKFVRTGRLNQGEEISFVLIKVTCKA